MGAGSHRLSRLPLWVNHWLGYRAETPPPSSNLVLCIWAFIGAFASLALLQGIFGLQYFADRNVPSIIASYGGSTVLVYGVIDSPFAQPRPVICGHFIAAVSGIIVTKVFLASGSESFNEYMWLAGALSCAIAIVAMQLTNTRHPPAGSTALLAAVNADVRDLGWYYLGIIMLSSVLVVAVAVITNNIQRNYPTFWFYYTDKMGTPLEMPEPEMMDHMGRDRRYSTYPIVRPSQRDRRVSTFNALGTVRMPPAVVVTDSSKMEFPSTDIEKQLPLAPAYF
ncbi:hypothetical protein Clacol_004281 [Clathrus columnatus]|uniref:HPP transmembrane region domain-containing protein n=1 Tax=Clathrus columnatus TaxID=1419009 RepID=A0AAV5AAW2_9AGAM|nr:hypothetical protein Clacol_004281 [Clathrus columnatus]